MNTFFNQLFLSTTLLIHSPLLPAFLSGTLVQTPKGYVAIEKVSVGDFVLCNSPGNDRIKTRITNKSSRTTNLIFVVQTKLTKIYATEDQLFFNPQQNHWVKVKNFTLDSWFVDRYGAHHQCMGITLLKQKTMVYELSLEHPHMFFVSKSQLLTHNILPIAISVGLAWGTGALTFERIALTVAGIGIAVTNWFRKGKQQESNVKVHVDVENLVGSAGSKKPDDDENKKKRIINKITKTEFFKKIKERYKFCKNEAYQAINKAKRIVKNGEYLKWDQCHNDVEVYNKAEKHLGSLDPNALDLNKPMNLYKNPAKGRTLFD